MRMGRLGQDGIPGTGNCMSKNAEALGSVCSASCSFVIVQA